MIKLTNTHRWKDELVIDYINKWINLSLNCKEKLIEISIIEICTQEMHWALGYIL